MAVPSNRPVRASRLVQQLGPSPTTLMQCNPNCYQAVPCIFRPLPRGPWQITGPSSGRGQIVRLEFIFFSLLSRPVIVVHLTFLCLHLAINCIRSISSLGIFDGIVRPKFKPGRQRSHEEFWRQVDQDVKATSHYPISQEQASPSNMSCFGLRTGAKRRFFLRLWTSSDELNAAARHARPARHKTTINRLTFQSRNNNPNPRPGDECTSYLRQVLRNDNFASTASSCHHLVWLRLHICGGSPVVHAPVAYGAWTGGEALFIELMPRSILDELSLDASVDAGTSGCLGDCRIRIGLSGPGQ